MIQLRPKSELAGGDLGWLKAKHHFTVSADGNPAHGPLGALVVWNDDEIQPGKGFPPHGHANIEIITYVREGKVHHKDSLGSEGTIDTGDVQVMSAGTGIRHDETCARDAVTKVFQIWIRPRQWGGAPRWDTRPFPKKDRAGRFIPLASGVSGDEDALEIRADARVLGATLNAGETLTYELAPGRKGYLVPAQGVVTVNELRVEAHDGVAIDQERVLRIRALENAELVLVDVA